MLSAASAFRSADVDADIDFEFDADFQNPPVRGPLSEACAEAVRKLTRLQRLVTPGIGLVNGVDIGQDDDLGVDAGLVPIDWQRGVAQLLDFQGNVRTQLHVAPAESARQEAIDDVAREFTLLVDGVCRAMISPGIDDRHTTRWEQASTWTLDGDLLCTGDFIIARGIPAPNGGKPFWAMRPDVKEIHDLMHQQPLRRSDAASWHGADRYPRPTFERLAPASSRRAGRFDETWVFDVSSDCDISTVLANSRAEPTRIFCVDRRADLRPEDMTLREIRRDPFESPDASADDAVTQARPHMSRAGERRVRAMVVGDSLRKEGSSQPRVGHYDAPSLARALKTAFSRIAEADGCPPIAPTHVSIVSSHHESESFRFNPAVPEPSFGTRFLKAATSLFQAPAMTASLRKDAFRVASQRPRHELYEEGEEAIKPRYNVVPTEDPDLDGRKFVRNASGHYVNKGPGGTVMLWRAEDGSIRSADKYPDLGQTHVKGSGLEIEQDAGPESERVPAQGPGKLIAWLQDRASPASGPLASATTGPGRSNRFPAAGAHRFETIRLGEVEVQRPLLRRMGWRDDGRSLNVPGAVLGLRFAPDALARFMADGTAPERIAALRLLKQMFRAGVPMRDVCRTPDSRSPSGRVPVDVLNLLLAINQALDDELMLPVSLWEALWDGTPPPLPRRVPDKGLLAPNAEEG
jgi:hypothetical protein